MATRGNAETDFSMIKEGQQFPTAGIKARNACWKYYHRLYDGSYAYNKKLVAKINSIDTEIPYSVIPINMFKLTVSKLDSLFFSNEISIKTGDIKRDERIAKLVERTNFIKTLRKAFKLAEIEGDSCIKVYKDGVSAFSPIHAFKVVDESNTDNVRAYVLYEYLTTDMGNNQKRVTHIRFEVHQQGSIFEQVFEYQGERVGNPVRYWYAGRWIPRSGREYNTSLDMPLVHWLSLNEEADSIYGQSTFLDFKDIIFALESRLSSELWIEDNHEKPFLVLGAEMFLANEETGRYELKQINGKYLVSHGNESAKPEYLTWDGKLENSQQIREDFLSYFYELSELGKTFLSGEYTGNISEETLTNTIKSAIDRGNRDLLDFYTPARDALYCLCKLNGISLNKEDLVIDFNVGRSDDDKVVAEVIKTLHEAGVFSMETLRAKYFGYNEKQSAEEDQKLANENAPDNNTTTMNKEQSEVSNNGIQEINRDAQESRSESGEHSRGESTAGLHTDGRVNQSNNKHAAEQQQQQ